MGVEAVAGPGSAAQVVEDRRLAVGWNDHIGVVDRPPVVAIPLEHRRRHQRYGWTGFTPELDVGKAAEESEIHLAVSQLIERLAGDEPDRLAERIAHPGSDEMVGRPDARSEKCGEDQLGRLAHPSTAAAGPPGNRRSARPVLLIRIRPDERAACANPARAACPFLP